MRTGAASAVGARCYNDDDVTMTIAGLWRYGDWRHVATGCTALVQIERLLCRRLDVVNFKEIGSLGRVKGAPHRFRFFLAEVRDFFCILRPLYTVSQKKGATLTMAITLSILGGFAKFFHRCKEQ